MKKSYLMTPGPTPVPTDVLLAGAKDVIHHRAPAFTKLLLDVTEKLKWVLQTKNTVLIINSSGTGAMESAVVNMFSPGDRVLVISTGNFGERFAKISNNYGLDVIKLDYEWGTAAVPADVERELDKDPSIKGVMVTHSETSTGVNNDIKEIARITNSHNTALIVDAISGLGASDLKTDEWGVDVVVAGSQKALMTPPGISFVSISDRAWKMVEESKLPKFYFDYKAARKMLESDSPQTPFTPAITLLVQLSSSLQMIMDDGLENLFARHAMLAKASRAAVKALGLKLLCDEKVASNSVTPILPPEGIEAGKVIKGMREDFGVTLVGGQGKLKGKIFRIGHCGYFEKLDIILTIAALEMTLKKLGYKFELGSGVKAAEEVFTL